MTFELFVAGRYLKAKRKGLFALVTTLIGVAGVAVGVAALLTTLSVMNGFQGDIQKKIIGAQSHIVIFGQLAPEAYSALEAKALRDPDVAAAAPVVLGQAILAFNKRSFGVMLRGLEPGKERNVSLLENSFTEGGWTPKPRPGEKTVPPPVVLGEELSRNMNIYCGDDVILISPESVNTGLGILPRMKKFRVSGLLKTGYYEFDSAMAYAKLSDASDFLGLGGAATGMEIRLHDMNTARAAAKRLSALAGFPYAVRTFADMNRTLYAALRLEKFVMFIILILIVFVAALNIASNLILLGVEKLRDIGIMRAMGAPPAVIRRIFLWEGFLIGTTGIALGLALGFALCWVIATFNIVELPGDIYYITRVPVQIKLSDVAAIIIGSYGLCFLATIYPAKRASSVSPVEAIHYG
ncbi:MAG: ABC transporter permease [Elusimicrobiales bacterium]